MTGGGDVGGADALGGAAPFPSSGGYPPPDGDAPPGDHHPLVDPPPGGGGGGAITIAMGIPHRRVGLVIGRGGENVRFLQDVSGARVQIQAERDVAPTQAERCVLRAPSGARRRRG